MSRWPSAARPIVCARSSSTSSPPVAISAFDGMQSQRWAAPPTMSRSISVTSAPSVAATRRARVARGATTQDHETRHAHEFRGPPDRTRPTRCPRNLIAMSELRHDPLSGLDVDRRRRARGAAVTFAARPAPTPTPAPTHCPFCPGHEAQTPPEVARTGAGAPDTPGWRVRVFPNLYPIVETHEVVVLSPDHDRSFGAARRRRGRRGVHRAARPGAHAPRTSGTPYAVAILNHLRAAGASIAHPHAQVFALDFVPAAVGGRVARFRRRRHRPRARRCRARPSSSSTARRRRRAWCPHASTSPYLLRVAHDARRRARSTPPPTTWSRPSRVALRDVLARLDAALGDPPYNLVVHTAPPRRRHRSTGTSRSTPRLSVVAGLRAGDRHPRQHRRPRNRPRDDLREATRVSVTIHICTTIAAPPDDGVAGGRAHRDPHRVDARRRVDHVPQRAARRRRRRVRLPDPGRAAAHHRPLRRHASGSRARSMGIEHRGAVTGAASSACARSRGATPPSSAGRSASRSRGGWAARAGEQLGRPVLTRIWAGNLRRLKARVEHAPGSLTPPTRGGSVKLKLAVVIVAVAGRARSSRPPGLPAPRPTTRTCRPHGRRTDHHRQRQDRGAEHQLRPRDGRLRAGRVLHLRDRDVVHQRDAAPDDGKWTVTPDTTAPYKTRIVVYRPIDPKKFNGTVMRRVAQRERRARRGCELDRSPTSSTSARAYAWVGVTAQQRRASSEVPNAARSLRRRCKHADPVRYGRSSIPGDRFSYDIYSQAGRAVRPDAPTVLGGLTPKHVIAVGESQSAFYLTTLRRTRSALTGRACSTAS